MTRHRFTIALLFLWGIAVSKAVRAQSSLADFIGPYDTALLQWAAGTALLGGIIRTILSLESDKRVVRDIVAEGCWDAAKSLVAGLLAFLLIQALRSSGWSIPPEVRFAAVLAAGWSRIAAIDWMKEAAMQWVNARKDQIIGRKATGIKDAP